MTSTLDLLSLWFRASSAPALADGSGGIFIRTTDVAFIRTRLFQARKANPDPAIAPLVIRASPRAPHEEVWIIRPSVDVPTAEELLT